MSDNRKLYLHFSESKKNPDKINTVKERERKKERETFLTDI